MQVVLLVYDVTNSSSFDILEEWLSAIHDINESNFQNKPIMVLVGNKCDMEHQRTVKREKSHRFAAENGLTYYDMSARTGESVRDTCRSVLFLFFFIHTSSRRFENSFL